HLPAGFGSTGWPSVSEPASVAITGSVPANGSHFADPGGCFSSTCVNDPSPRPTRTGTRTALPPSATKHANPSPCLTTAADGTAHASAGSSAVTCANTYIPGR